MSFSTNGWWYYSALILCDYSAIILCEFSAQYNFSETLMKLIENVEEIKKNIRPWGWGPHVFKLQRFEWGITIFYFL